MLALQADAQDDWARCLQASLESLIDVQCVLLEDSMSFRLIFKFAANDFFINNTLQKTYHLVDDDEPILEKAEGCGLTIFEHFCPRYETALSCYCTGVRYSGRQARISR